MIRRTKKLSIEIHTGGRRSSVNVDALVAAFIPPDIERTVYVRQRVAALWHSRFPGEPLPDDPIGELCSRFDCGASSVVATAITHCEYNKWV